MAVTSWKARSLNGVYAWLFKSSRLLAYSSDPLGFQSLLDILSPLIDRRPASRFSNVCTTNQEMRITLLRAKNYTRYANSWTSKSVKV